MVAIAWLLPAGGPRAEHPADGDFFRGRELTYLVSTKPGGGYDTYARLIARHLAPKLGAEIVVRNVPGAGHLIGTNQLYRAKPDGLTIGTFNTGLVYAQLLRREGVAFDLRELSWIGKAASDPRIFVIGSQQPARSVEALRAAAEPVLLATSGVSTASYNEMALLSRALDFEVKPVVGYGGRGGEMGILRGEVAATLGSYSSLRPFVENGFGRILFRVGGDVSLGDQVPDARDLARHPDAGAIIDLVEAQAQLGRLTAAPPGVPRERLEVLRAAYAAALADEALLREAARLKIPIDPLGGEAVAKRIARALDQPASTAALLASIANGE